MGESKLLKVKNKSIIKEVHLKHPEIMAKGIEEKIKEAYYHLFALQEQLYEARDEVWKLEKQVKKAKEEFDVFKDLCELEFETSEKEYKTHQSNVVFNGLVYGNGHK